MKNNEMKEKYGKRRKQLTVTFYSHEVDLYEWCRFTLNNFQGTVKDLMKQLRKEFESKDGGRL